MDVMPKAVADRLNAQRAAIHARAAVPQTLIDSLIQNLPSRRDVRPFNEPYPRLRDAWCRISLEHGGEYLSAVNKAMMVELALSLPMRLTGTKLPRSVLDSYPAAYGRMLDYIEDPSSPYDWSTDAFIKDLRLFSGVSVPAKTRIVDLNGHVGRRLSLEYWRRKPSLRALPHFSLKHGLTPWFCFHIDERSMAGFAHLSDFNEAAWDACYRVIADLLETQPRTLGLVGSSWFFDPAMEQVSPYLTFLRERPLERGAFVVRQEASAYAMHAATTASAKRRKLVEMGRYVPCNYALVWPRQALLAWARTPA